MCPHLPGCTHARCTLAHRDTNIGAHAHTNTPVCTRARAHTCQTQTHPRTGTAQRLSTHPTARQCRQAAGLAGCWGCRRVPGVSGRPCSCAGSCPARHHAPTSPAAGTMPHTPLCPAALCPCLPAAPRHPTPRVAELCPSVPGKARLWMLSLPCHHTGTLASCLPVPPSHIQLPSRGTARHSAHPSPTAPPHWGRHMPE